jgi:hypothetical protein
MKKMSNSWILLQYLNKSNLIGSDDNIENIGTLYLFKNKNFDISDSSKTVRFLCPKAIESSYIVHFL